MNQWCCYTERQHDSCASDLDIRLRLQKENDSYGKIIEPVTTARAWYGLCMEVKMINADFEDKKNILQLKLVFAGQLVAHGQIYIVISRYLRYGLWIYCKITKVVKKKYD